MISVARTFWILNLNCLLLLVSITIIDASSKWSYTGKTGPEFWATIHGGEECGGASQSPVDIDTDNVVETYLGPFEINYESHMAQMSNNGHSLTVALKGSYTVSGGGLPHTYSAVQLHFHWGRDANEGSEHTRNGAAYPAELHIVHYDSDKYFDVYAALVEPQGLAVLGFWVEIGEENPALNPIIKRMQNITYKGQKSFLTYEDQLTIKDILPTNLDKFYRYEGSLTTPDCFESVVWTVFAEPIVMSADQLASFRKLSQLTVDEIDDEMNKDMKHNYSISGNYRPVQDLNERTVYVNNMDLACGGAALAAHVLHIVLLFIATYTLMKL